MEREDENVNFVNKIGKSLFAKVETQKKLCEEECPKKSKTRREREKEEGVVQVLGRTLGLKC